MTLLYSINDIKIVKINIIIFNFVKMFVLCRTLGSIASVVAEKKSIHHSIRNSLDSHDAVEMKAAIYATAKFAAQSKYCF